MISLRVKALSLAVAGLVSTGALAIDEMEVNHPANNAQNVPATSSVLSLGAVLGNGGADDVDYYVFDGTAGDVVTFDIDGGYGVGESVDTYMAVFGPGPDFKILRMNDDKSPVDEGSVSSRDSRIENFVLPSSGRYTVGVSNYPRYFKTGGEAANPGKGKTGDYQLIISGVTPQVKQIAIEVKPGSEELAPVNPKSKGKIPVALLGGVDFDVMTVDAASLTFGSTGDEASLFKCDWTGSDVNGDGRVDRVCHFENQQAGFEVGDLEGVLHGRMTDGTAIEGRAFLKVLPQKGQIRD